MLHIGVLKSDILHAKRPGYESRCEYANNGKKRYTNGYIEAQRMLKGRDKWRKK